MRAWLAVRVRAMRSDKGSTEGGPILWFALFVLLLFVVIAFGPTIMHIVHDRLHH